MNNELVNVTGIIDRLLFSIGIFLTIIFVVLKFIGIIEWEWKWIISPAWIYLILTFLRMKFIVKPTIRKEYEKDL
jgi:hypothetical protein